MQIKNKKPPFYFLIRLRFPKANMDTAVFTFGKTVYAKEEMPLHLQKHEEVHTKQQKHFIGGMWWWTKYMISKKFRFNQELEAYRVQFTVFRSSHSVSKSRRFLAFIADSLSGGLYGKGITFQEAKALVLQSDRRYGK